MANVPKLADFGDKAWPQDPLIELAWRLVYHVAVQVQGKTACMKSVPMMDPSLGYTLPEYSSMPSGAPSSTTQTVALGAALLPTEVVLCVWGTRPSGHQRQGSLPP